MERGVTDMGKQKKDYVGDQISEWFESQIRDRTNMALKQRNEQFGIDHAADTDEQLIDYVKQCAEKLGRAPCMEEVIGGKVISERFGGWIKLLNAADLPVPRSVPKRERRQIYRDEYRRQTKLLKQEIRSNRKTQRENRLRQAAISNAEKSERLQRDMAWGAEHETDTDDELLNYVRQYAADLGHTPFSREVPGAQYISQRFGGWAVVLTLAELPLPKDMCPPTASQLQKYQNNQNRIT